VCKSLLHTHSRASLISGMNCRERSPLDRLKKKEGGTLKRIVALLSPVPF
jgi:hypothetical protein